ncbi:Threonine synthase [Olavius algarvensis spirochete endosymbiont]|nr:cysteate synthase [Alkalispirochaeta odontotermitis]VDB00071.1 Threonine synthase [Olavius algarvensis spirochete endosymbiont]
MGSGRIGKDVGGWTLDMSEKEPSLIRAIYERKEIRLRNELEGLYRFADWLPIRRMLKNPSVPICYRSEGLANDLGLKKLYIIFNGWWPEKGAAMSTGTFKECEAYSVCARLPENFDGSLVVASAGNTARAFVKVCSDNDISLLLFVPHDNLDALWFDTPVASCVKLICVAPGGDYYDSILMSTAAIAASKRFIPEGGAKNIARRDGMGTTLLSAAAEIGNIPDVYFQAVGSGTGAIAAWEAAMRLESDGRWGPNNMRLILSQNAPFIPMVESLAADSRVFIVVDDDTARRQISQVTAKVLTNRNPPWAIAGGLYDAVRTTAGTILGVSNDEAGQAASRFQRLEGVSISPAAAVAVSSLIQAVQRGIVTESQTIALNITGGGIDRLKQNHPLYKLEPSVILPPNSDARDIKDAVTSLFV